MRPGQTIQPVDLLTDLPALAQAGSCFAMDRSGEGRYLYVLVPTGAATATFWRYDTRGNTWQQLATPTLGANSVIGVGTAMILDESTGSVWLFNAESAGVFAQWQRYDPATNTWTARNTAALALVAQWSTDACLTHTCAALSPVWSGDNLMYLVGNGTASMYRYEIAANLWTVLAGVRAGIPGAGATLDVSPINPDVIYSLRGGGSTLFERNTISTDVWANVALIPNTEAFGAGTESCVLTSANPAAIIIHQGGRIKAIEAGATAFEPVANIYGADGTAHVGRGIAGYSVGSAHYILVRPHGKAELQRIRLVT